MAVSDLYIDGVDIATFGARLVQGGLNGVLSYPALKGVEVVSWPESDGAVADLSNIKLGGKDFTFTFALNGENSDLTGFYSYLTQIPYRIYNFYNIGRSYRLRVQEMTTLSSLGDQHLVSCKMSDDFPLRNYEYVAPSRTVVSCDDYKLDLVYFSTYGIRVGRGTLQNIVKPGKVKPLLTRDISILEGRIYDASATAQFIGPRQVTLDCLMSAPTLSQLWTNYDAFLYRLSYNNTNASDATQKGLRKLYVKALSKTFDAFYMGQSVTDFAPANGTGEDNWIRFTLTMYLLN